MPIIDPLTGHDHARTFSTEGWQEGLDRLRDAMAAVAGPTAETEENRTMTDKQRPERPFRTIPLGEAMQYRAEYGTDIPVTNNADDKPAGTKEA